MNIDLHNEVIYRCVSSGCKRPMPRRVNYCPYCGTSQDTGLPRADDPAPRPAPRPVVSNVKPAPQPAAPPAPPPAAPPPPPVRAAVAAAPPQREPVRLRWWLLALGALWLIWVIQRPGTRNFDARIEKAIALATDCKPAQAQSELIALKEGGATPAQLLRVQAALNDADAACAAKRGRARAAPRVNRAPASPQAQSARNLVADARLALERGDYKAASDKMEVCTAMVDAGNGECIALKARADRLQGDLQRCLAAGREWIGDRCQ
ncbi:hypothetical protein Q4S45_15810 [Massilia sp. R2A-15]|uniref:hypothetical protein n=1 Tax=Massilia sp. R2A-15 TaxID=3064278 RepID=UPI00273320F6|nr:hypothetical protein [Massilia sp. R2A-15]WLI88193.1 hypothetical protein Q4S45_15810 [Massilia sp. R2A-15]